MHVLVSISSIEDVKSVHRSYMIPTCSSQAAQQSTTVIQANIVESCYPLSRASSAKGEKQNEALALDSSNPNTHTFQSKCSNPTCSSNHNHKHIHQKCTTLSFTHSYKPERQIATKI